MSTAAPAETRIAQGRETTAALSAGDLQFVDTAAAGALAATLKKHLNMMKELKSKQA